MFNYHQYRFTTEYISGTLNLGPTGGSNSTGIDISAFIDTNVENQSQLYETMQDGSVQVTGSRYFSPIEDARSKLRHLWRKHFGTDQLNNREICYYLSLDEMILVAIDKQLDITLPLDVREKSQDDVSYLIQLRDNVDVSYVFLVNLIDLYRKMLEGEDFSRACYLTSLVPNRSYTVEEIKAEMVLKAKRLFCLLDASLGTTLNDFSRVQVTTFSLFGIFFDFSVDDFYEIFPLSLMEKVIDMISNKSFEDYTKTSFLSFLKGLAEKNPQKFYSAYFDSFFTKRNLFVIIPQFSSYWVNYLFILSQYAASTVFKLLISKIPIVVSVDNNDPQKEAVALTMFDCMSQILNRQGKEFAILNASFLDSIDLSHLQSVSIQKQFFKIQNEMELIMKGVKSSPISIYMKTLEKTSINNTVFIVEFNGTKKKMSMLESCGHADLLVLIEEKFSIDKNDVLITIFDDECRDYVELDPSEHDFKKMSQPIKIKMTERVEKQEITESSLISSIDQYRISKHLKSEREQTADLISMTFIAEEKQLNKDVKRVAIKYLNFKGNKAEGNLSENILTLKKVKEFEKSNLIPIYDILKPEAVNKQKVKKVHHLAFTMPYYSHGSVASIMKEKVSLSTRMILSLLKYSLEAFNSLEEARFEYGNIKEDNILIETLDLSSGTIRVRISGKFIFFICDF